MVKFLFTVALLVLQSCRVSALDFEWASPHPHRQAWHAMASGNGKLVGITDGFGGRTLYTSRDGRNWTQPASAPRSRLWDVRFYQGQFLAVGSWGSGVFTSIDGENWQEHPTGFNVTYKSIAVGNGVTIAVGDYGHARVSANLTDWRAVDSFVGNDGVRVAFGNGRFVAASLYRVWTSTDGANWTLQNAPASGYSDLVFSNGRFAMVVGEWKSGELWHTGGILTSTDGVRWEIKDSPLYKLIATNDGFLAINNGLWRSADARTWEKILDYRNGDHLSLTAAAKLNGTLVVGGMQGILLVSENGGPFEELVKAAPYANRKLAFGNGAFLLYGDAAAVKISTDTGTTWESTTAPMLLSAAYGKGVWVGATTNGNFATSADGRTWTTSLAPIPVRRIDFANDLFLAQTYDGWGGAAVPAIAISSNGLSWRKIDFEDTASVAVFGNVNGRWAGAISNQRPVTSEDGTNWTVHPSDPDLRTRLMAAGNGRFLSFGGAGMGPGTASWSVDGINWESRTLGPTQMELSMTFVGDRFFLTDGYGDLYTSRDGLLWTGQRQVEYLACTGVAFGNGRFLVAVGDSVLRSVELPDQPITLKMQQSGPLWYVHLQSLPGRAYELQSAPGVNGPWKTFRISQLRNDNFDMDLVDISTGSTFFRALAIDP